MGGGILDMHLLPNCAQNPVLVCLYSAIVVISKVKGAIVGSTKQPPEECQNSVNAKHPLGPQTF